MPEATIYEKKNHLAIVTMNRPDAMNAMNVTMRRELGEVYTDFRDDPDSWVLIITGAGDKAFSAGMDLKEMASRLAGGAAVAEANTPSLMAGNIEIWKPIIAAINGVAVGGGLELALACDIRIMAEHARTGLMEPKRGIVPGGKGSIRLPRLVPLGIAMEMLLSGDLITAQEAYRIGLANQVVPASELMPAAFKMAERFIDCAPLAVQSIKETVIKTVGMPLDQALNARFGINIMATEDAREGTAAFAQKRKPVWKGK
ncbi:MAG: enoyl-CoA hydratase/isomerase family protein [Chloroflexi bacterium]|nr:enoyl-CoA hydratase/isomerase family protein [Chloroflexota bacterium]